MSPRRDVSMSEAEIAAFLDLPLNAVLTTLSGDGWPHSTAMWFVAEAGAASMWTYAKSQKALNAARDPRCSLLVEDGEAYDQLRGVLIQGRIEVIDAYEEIRQIGVELYRRYTQPAVGIPVEDGPILEIERQARKRVGLRLPFERVASWDHRKL